MDKETQEYRKFLEDQLEWCKKQDHILEEIEDKLYEMKEIAECALANDVNTDEIERLNHQMDNLKKEIQYLEKQIHAVVH
ncbi:hypothetical protein SAMN05421670_2569 [Psychrobacillus psychrotolerans]|uniref:Uncharacterized protein n=1 Tax=Psychrobacillus psychrotolerans TaxID=126156 RepID=A0A1I5ZAM5_9BACI|nr:hypothetical protein [Psychrobacillus psychrotolerans]SFQ53500.1 hypothetical protein SAMN05421670_2569 [Psychrobacillus psychrotolerans]